MLSPERISYRTGALVTATIGLIMMPWKLMASTSGSIVTWLTGYGALLGPIVGILIADYWLVRDGRIDVDALYREDDLYTYRRGWNPAALFAFALGLLPNVPGFLKVAAPDIFVAVPSQFSAIYTYAWFVGISISLVSYAVLMRRPVGALVSVPR